MKKLTILSAAITFAAMLATVVYSLANPISPAREMAQTEKPREEQTEYDPAQDESWIDESASISVWRDGKTAETDMKSYLVGVVVAEMPVSFETEALRAQAVAARTYTLYRMENGGCPSHPEADTCTDPACCKAYLSDDELKARWGTGYSAYIEKVRNAVSSTDGLCLVYGNEPILAAFHSSSAGETESSEGVWGKALPYLVPVDSPETENDVVNYREERRYSTDEFRSLIGECFPDADLSSDQPAQWIGSIAYTDGGRVETVEIGGTAVAGTELRAALGLRSACMEFSADTEGVTITTTGYGHGVGMSQYGANVLARQGKDFEEILSWYYTGAELVSAAQLNISDVS